jgi:hypothetical protein
VLFQNERVGFIAKRLLSATSVLTSVRCHPQAACQWRREKKDPFAPARRRSRAPDRRVPRLRPGDGHDCERPGGGMVFSVCRPVNSSRWRTSRHAGSSERPGHQLFADLAAQKSSAGCASRVGLAFEGTRQNRAMGNERCSTAWLLVPSRHPAHLEARGRPGVTF